MRHRRKELDLSQDELADRVGCSQGAVSAWELGIGSVREKRHRRMLEAIFDAEISDLMRNDAAPKGDAAETAVPPNSRYAQR
ncbi:MAG: helix-turn-helix transcriptional regulator [Solirubrobacterales bacterium]